MTSKDSVFRLSSKEWTNFAELTSDKKKANTKMLLCAKYATILHDNVFISVPKTFKFIITLRKIKEVAAHINKLNGTKRNRQITDVNILAGNVDVSLNMNDYLQESFLSIMAGIHCFTGLDTLSAFPEKICMYFP